MTNPNPMDMLKQMQQMQADMQAAQEALANTTLDATVGGGVVRATVTGDGELLRDQDRSERRRPRRHRDARRSRRRGGHRSDAPGQGAAGARSSARPPAESISASMLGGLGGSLNP